MDIESIRDFCLAKEDVTESFPFGDTALVFKRSGKIFVILMLDDIPLSLNLKCDPEKAVQLREQYDFVKPGYHMNKRHWNTVTITDGLPAALLQEWIEDSYNLVERRKRQEPV